MPPQATDGSQEQLTFGRGRFSSGAYNLNFSKVQDVPLRMNGQPSTLVDVYAKLRDSKVNQIDEPFGSDRYQTEEGEINLDGEIAEWPLKATIRELAGLLKQGIDPYRVIYYYFSHDYSIDGDETHQFFAVHGDKIVGENLSFSSEEPRVLAKVEAKDYVWTSHRYFDQAVEIYWYRRFYTETLTGKLMVLRQDEPILFHFERPPTRDLTSAAQFSVLMKIYRLLGIAVALLIARIFPVTEIPMLVLAGIAGLDLIRIWWVTRKLLQSEN